MPSRRDRCCYDVLGVKSNDSALQIKRAYRRLAMKYHPDRNPGNKQAAESFKEVNEAYNILNDEDKRAYYDSHMKTGGTRASFRCSDEKGPNFDDIFSQFDGYNRDQKEDEDKEEDYEIEEDDLIYDSCPIKGMDLCYRIFITLENSVKGCILRFKFPMLRKCNICEGTGRYKSKVFINCSSCNGEGYKKKASGFFSYHEPCFPCRGKGKTLYYPCEDCKSSGKIKFIQPSWFYIKRGIGKGDRLMIKEQGDAGFYGGKDGDFYLEIGIKKHKLFSRLGNDIYCDLPIEFAVATLGGSIIIPNIFDSKPIQLTVPNGTKTGSIFKISQKGVVNLSGNLGNFFCRLVIKTPTNLNEEQKRLLTLFHQSFKRNNFFIKKKQEKKRRE